MEEKEAGNGPFFLKKEQNDIKLSKKAKVSLDNLIHLVMLITSFIH